MARPKYIPEVVSEVVKETGAHFMCILAKAAERGINVATASKEEIRRLAEECVREGKLVPVLKVLQRAGVKR